MSGIHIEFIIFEKLLPSHIELSFLNNGASLNSEEAQKEELFDLNFNLNDKKFLRFTPSLAAFELDIQLNEKFITPRAPIEPKHGSCSAEHNLEIKTLPEALSQFLGIVLM